MIRRLVLAAALAAALSGAGAATASALPVDGSASRWACVAILPADTGYCVSNPLDAVDAPDAPGTPRVPTPPLP